MDSSNKISFLNKNLFFNLPSLFHDWNKEFTLHHDSELLHYDSKSEATFQEMTDLFTPSRTELDLMHHNGFSFSSDFIYSGL